MSRELQATPEAPALSFCPVTDRITVVHGTIPVGKRPLPSAPDGDLSRALAIDYCSSGTCELWTPSGELVLMRPGRCSVGMGEDIPNLLFYPLEPYVGTKIILRDGALEDPAFSLLQEFGFSYENWLSRVRGDPLIWHSDARFRRLFEEVECALDPPDLPLLKVRILEILAHLERCAIQQAPVTCYSRSQLEIAKQVHDRLTADLSAPYDLKGLAEEHKIEVTSLNRYFEAVYGESVPKWIRSCRIRHAQDLLQGTSLPVAEIAARVGYSNASKFSAAFKKETGLSPREYRQETPS